jgi:hypothetical protein
MPEVLLDRTGINTFIDEIKPAGMPEHMGMNGKREAGELARRMIWRTARAVSGPPRSETNR